MLGVLVTLLFVMVGLQPGILSLIIVGSMFAGLFGILLAANAQRVVDVTVVGGVGAIREYVQTGPIRRNFPERPVLLTWDYQEPLGGWLCPEFEKLNRRRLKRALAEMGMWGE